MQRICSEDWIAGCPAGVAVGLLALGESLPTSRQGRNMTLLAWLCIGAGVAMLANGQGETAALSVICRLYLCRSSGCTTLLLKRQACLQAFHEV